MIVGNRGLGQDRHPGARRNQVGDQTHTFDFDRDAQRRPARPAPPIPARRATDSLAGGRINDSRPSVFNGIGARACPSNDAGTKRDQLLVAQVLDVQPRIADGLGDDGARELAVDDFGREPFTRALV